MSIFNFNKNIYSKFGYISDQKGILSRYNREKKNWDEHLNNCKKYLKNKEGKLCPDCKLRIVD